MRKYLPHILIISFVLLCNFGCVTTKQLQRYEAQGVLNTNEGTPGIYINSDIENVQNVIIEGMTGEGSAGYVISAENRSFYEKPLRKHMISFSQPIEGFSGFLLSSLGEESDSAPKVYVDVDMIEVAQGRTKVMMSSYAVFGADRAESTERNTALMDLLLAIKSEAEHQSGHRHRQHSTYEPIPKSLASSAVTSVVDGFLGFLGIALLVADQVPNGEDSVGHPISVFNTTTPSGTYPGGTYPGESSGHWILENIDAGSMMVLEDNSVWEIDPLDKISESTFLWLLTSEITIVTSNSGSPGYDYLLINADDGGKPHAKFLGWKNELN